MRYHPQNFTIAFLKSRFLIGSQAHWGRCCRDTAMNILGDLATFLNVGRIDRTLRVALGIGLGIAGILVSRNSYLGWALGIAGASLILSGVCGI
jgi:Protein of unknown function (DUF2892)